jgi:hypothetical protein
VGQDHGAPMNHTRLGIAAALLASLVASPFLPATAPAQLAGQPGAFSRMGFGARGMAMGNALSAIPTGELSSYYNPALAPLAGYRSGSASFGILSLDRSLNFLSYSMPLPPKAGLALGLINSGVSGIDGRDGDGVQTGALRTSENLIFLGFGIRPGQDFSLGVNIKMHHYHLYTSVTSVTVGFDFGAYFQATPELGTALTFRNINSRYKWDTGPLFGQQGQTSEDRFPQLVTLGVSYRIADSLAILGAEVEFSNKETILARAGVEVSLIPEVTVRAGVDRVDLQDKGNGIKPSVGFTLRKTLGNWTPAIHYAFIVEPFSPTDLHMITVSAAF